MTMPATYNMALNDLATLLTALRHAREDQSRFNKPTTEIARQRQRMSQGYLQALDEVAKGMGLKVTALYTVPERVSPDTSVEAGEP